MGETVLRLGNSPREQFGGQTQLVWRDPSFLRNHLWVLGRGWVIPSSVLRTSVTGRLLVRSLKGAENGEQAEGFGAAFSSCDPDAYIFIADCMTLVRTGAMTLLPT